MQLRSRKRHGWPLGAVAIVLAGTTPVGVAVAVDLPAAPSVPSAPVSVPHVVPTSPPVSVPSPPSTPLVSAPSVPSAPSASVPDPPSAPVLSATAPQQGAAAPGSGSGGGSAGASGDASPSGEADTPASAPARGGATRSVTARQVRARRRAADRRLRRDLRRLDGCLSGLGAAERRVLVTRANLAGSGVASRADVARGLGISTRRVTVLERTGLRKLRAAASSGGCGSSSSTSVVTPAAFGFGGGLGAGVGGLAGSPGGSTLAEGDSPPTPLTTQPPPELSPAGADAGAVDAAYAVGGPAATTLAGQASGQAASLPALLALAGLLALAVVLTRDLGRRRTRRG